MSDVSTGPSSDGPVTGEDPTFEPVADAEEASGDVAEPSELEIALLERDEWMDRAQRIAADFENYRRRLATQRADDIDRATGRLAESLLPVLDACEAAFLQHPAEIEPLFNLMLSELKKQGLESMNLHEQPFDPHLADAVLHEPGEGEPIVSEVLRSGYTWNGKVLRPAMVKVRG
jgi:molecular chaperone GrpE